MSHTPRAASLILVLLATGSAPWCGSIALASGPEVPGGPQQKPIALINAVIHPVSSDPVVGVLVFDKGRITALGASTPIPPEAEQIDLQGKHVYPGLFDAMSDMGLVEIEAVRATLDQSETGAVNPNVRAQVAVNPDSSLIPVARSNGLLLMLTAPSGGLIRGQSAVIQMDGWTWEEMTLHADVAMHVRWPQMPPVVEFGETPSRRRGRGRQGGAPSEDRDRADPLQPLKDALEAARAYQTAMQSDADTPRDIRWEAMLPVLRGEMPWMVAADDSAQIQSALAFTQREGLKLIIYGGYDAPHCATLLKESHVPVIVGGVYRLPMRRDADYDEAYTVARRLHEAGVTFCVSGAGAMGASNARNLPYHAATAAAYGLPRDIALKSITLYPAQILGVADRVGSLEPGKHATLIVTDGDPLEIETHVEAAYIQGRKVDLSNRQKRLYEKYQQKYQR